MDEREELAVAIARAESRTAPLSREDMEAKIERGFLQSERGEVTDGDAVSTNLLRELDEMERSLRS